MRHLVLALALCCALSHSAVAKPLNTAIVGHGTRMIGSDGARFVAWMDEDVAGTYVYDAVTHKTTPVAPPAGCSFTAIGAGALVATCDAYPLLSSAQLLDLRSGVWRQAVPPTADSVGFTRERRFVGVGTRWIRARFMDYHVEFSAFYARADGAQYMGLSPFGAHVQPDLDAPGLRREICSPLSATKQDPSEESNDHWHPLQLAGRFAIATPPLSGAIVLRRCGQRSRRILCRHWCITPTLQHGHVLWGDPAGRVRVRDVGGAKGRVFTVPGYSVSGVYPVGSRVVLAAHDYDPGQLLIRSVSARALGIG